MEEKITAIFDALKRLEIVATPNNVSILNGVFNVLRGIYAEITTKEGEPDERSANSAE